MPTPVNKKNEPDLKNIKEAANLVARIIKKGDVVVIESTVYPGVTEEFVGPLIEKNLD